MKPLRIFLLASLILVVFGMDNVEAESGVEMDVDVTSIERDPGSSANFSVVVKNTGDENDTILFSILEDHLGWGSVYPESVDLGVNETETVTVTVALPEYDLNNLSNNERDALEENQYEVRIKAKCESDLSVSDVSYLTTNIGQIYGARLTVIGSDTVVTYPSTEDSANDRREKFSLRLINLGNRQDSILVETIETTYPDEWTVEIFQQSSCSSSFSGSIGAGQSKYLYLCVTPDEDADEGNYTVITEASANDGDEEAVQASVTVDVRDPTRDLALTPIDTIQEIYPEYKGTSEQNSVKFKVKLENVGSHKDTYIPEVASNLEDGWSVSFWQDSGKTQAWSSSGVEIEAGELDDLWVFVSVDDEAEVGNETIEISVRNEEDNPNAREVASLTVVIQRPELTVSPSNIRIEIDGVFGNASQVKDGDTVVIYVDVENRGNADADDVNVEIYYYPKKAPTTQQEIDDLLIQGFRFDEGKGTYIYSLYGSSGRSTDINSQNQKSIVSDDWLIKAGEWYVEVRVDYDEDDDSGEILEENENDNDARYSELLRVKPDLQITAMRVDSKYAGTSGTTPNVDDTVTFTVTVSNTGAADVKDARLYITADTSSENVMLKDRTNKEYVDFDVDAGETTYVVFRWKAIEEEWTTFRAEINPVCEHYNIQDFTCESEGDGFSKETGRMFDEVGRYANNEYPRSGVFEQDGEDVRFEVLPDFIIKKVIMDPTSAKVGESVEITVTVENIGNADWQISYRPLMVIFEDGTGTEISQQIGESISKSDTTEVRFDWEVPRQGNLILTFTIDAGSGNFEIRQCNDCDPANSGDGTDNDEYSHTITVGSSGFVLPSEGKVCTDDGEIENAADGCNQCICNEGEWVCTSVECSDDSDTSLPSISLITSIISIGLLARLRRKL